MQLLLAPGDPLCMHACCCFSDLQTDTAAEPDWRQHSQSRPDGVLHFGTELAGGAWDERWRAYCMNGKAAVRRTQGRGISCVVLAPNAAFPAVERRCARQQDRRFRRHATNKSCMALLESNCRVGELGAVIRFGVDLDSLSWVRAKGRQGFVLDGGEEKSWWVHSRFLPCDTAVFHLVISPLLKSSFLCFMRSLNG